MLLVAHQLQLQGLLHARGGVSPTPPIKPGDASRLLHARGGVSLKGDEPSVTAWSSPRTWRCFWCELRGALRRYSLLHARGGVSKSN